MIAGEVLAIAADGDRFVAVGRTAEAQGSWISTDGGTWDSVPVSPPTDVLEGLADLPADYATRGSAMGALVRLDETLYSFGFFNFMDFIRPVAWRWTDGEQWEPIVSTSEFFQGGSVTAVVAGSGTLVAARLGPAISWSGANSTVWAWRQDTSWVQGDLSAADDVQTFITDLAWHDGQYLAIGFVVNPDEAAPVGRPVVWTSADGVSWIEIAAPTDQGRLCALESNAGGGFIALGVEDDRAVVWTSRDGSDWEGAALPGLGIQPVGAGPFSWPCDLVTVGRHALAVIRSEDGSRTWTTSTGTEWMPGPELPVASVGYPGGQNLAALNGTLVLFTHEQDTELGVTSTIQVGVAAP